MKAYPLWNVSSAVGALLLATSLNAFAATWTSDTHILAPGDFNNDGRADLLVIAKDASQPTGIALNDGSQPNVFHQSWASGYLGITWSGGTYVPAIGD